MDLPVLRLRGKNNPAYLDHQADLARTCETCPVRVSCLWDALANDSGGIWAGTNEYQRADMREALGLAEPVVTDSDEDSLEARFAAHRLAWKGLTNTEIAEHMSVSAMTVSRLLDDDPDRVRQRRKTG